MKFLLFLIVSLLVIESILAFSGRPIDDNPLKCSQHTKCPTGLLCGSNGYCYRRKGKSVGGSCNSKSKRCRRGYICDKGTCRRGRRTILGTCSPTKRCAESFKCINKKCHGNVYN